MTKHDSNLENRAGFSIDASRAKSKIQVLIQQGFNIGPQYLTNTYST